MRHVFKSGIDALPHVDPEFCGSSQRAHEAAERCPAAQTVEFTLVSKRVSVATQKGIPFEKIKAGVTARFRNQPVPKILVDL
jgi:hypothetical protein